MRCGCCKLLLSYPVTIGIATPFRLQYRSLEGINAKANRMLANKEQPLKFCSTYKVRVSNVGNIVKGLRRALGKLKVPE
jgi:hypothetical protein